MSKRRSARSACRKFPNVSNFLEEKLFHRRKRMKLSQMTLAERAGLTRNCIQQMECHEHLPLPSTMFRLIKALEFDEKEVAAFWAEIEIAYEKDRALQEAEKTEEAVR